MLFDEVRIELQSPGISRSGVGGLVGVLTSQAKVIPCLRVRRQQRRRRLQLVDGFQVSSILQQFLSLKKSPGAGWCAPGKHSGRKQQNQNSFCNSLFGGQHQGSWYHPCPDVSRNAQNRVSLPFSFAGLGCALMLLAVATTIAADNFPFPRTVNGRSRVIIVTDPEATEAFEPRPDRVKAMVDEGMAHLTQKTNSAQAWLSLVSTQDIVGIKVFSEPGPNSGTRRAVVAAVVEGLLSAGLKTNQVIIWDKYQSDLRLAGYEETNFYAMPLLGNLVWGDHEFGRKGEGVGRKSFVSKLVTEQMTKIIQITPLINHNEAGVCGNLFSLALGSVDNTTRFLSDSGRLATALPEIYALPALGDRVVLNIVDALICQYEGEERSLLHYSTMLNQLRFSTDPVALDVLSLTELEHQRELNKSPVNRSNLALYDNAALLELGVNDPRRIVVERVPPAP